MSEIGFSPSTLEVDYDKNLTELYQAITDQNWDLAIEVCKSDPEQAATWVVRHYEEDEDEDDPEIMWRFLPLHSACARQPPVAVITSLLRAYPDGAKCQDDQGMYALHYACGNQATRDVIRVLLVSYPDAAKRQDPRGMLPIHYLACWGPSSVGVVDMLLVANRDVADAKDSEGNTPMDLARDGDYPEKKSVISALHKWFSANSSNASTDSGDAAPLSKRQSGRFSNVTKDSMKSSGSKSSGRSKRSEMKSETDTRVSKSSRGSGNKASRLPTTSDKKTAPAVGGTKKIRSRGFMHETEEEKKEDMEEGSLGLIVAREAAAVATRTTLKPAISPDEVKRLQEEIRSLRSEKSSWEKKLAEANIKCQLQQEEIIDLKEELDDAKQSASVHLDGDSDLSRELEKTRGKLKGCTEELKGLRITMVDMMEEHDELKKRSAGMNDRLTSLTVSLEAMMSQHKDLTKSLRHSSEQRKKIIKERQKTMQTLVAMDENFEEDEEVLENKLKKQSKEMEALAAMIAAAREP